MARLYYPELLEESQKELINFIKWCNKIYGYHPIIIGGWAVWAYTKYTKSIDIDIILPTTQAIHSLLTPYYKANNFKSAGILTKEYFREIKTREGSDRVYLDASSYANKNILKEKIIEIPWNLLEKNSKEYNFNGAKARIPIPELLLIYKVKALRDRRFELTNTEIVGARRDFLESKIEKDENDIKQLLKIKINQDKLNQLLGRLKFREIFEETVRELKGLEKETKK